jgi:hypothetical protein
MEQIMTKNTVLSPFLNCDHVLGVTVPLPYRYRPQGTPLPQRDSPFLKKGRCTKATHSVLLQTVPSVPKAF